jgi:hypothetical protein
MRVHIQRKKPRAPVHMIWGGIVILTVATVHVWERFLQLWPECPFFRLTGIPCLTCGGTRCLISFSDMSLEASFFYNPLIMVSIVGLVFFSLAVLVGWLFEIRLAFIMNERDRFLFRASIAAAIIANWVFLIIRMT